MKKLLWIFLYGLIALLGGLVFAALWSRIPALWVINLPDVAWIYLQNLFDAHCCESAHDLQITVAILFGALITGLCLWIIRILIKRWR
jgi:hypothetical protein